MGFQLLEDEELWLSSRVLTKAGYSDAGVYYPAEYDEGYLPFEGEWEPMGEGEKVRVLPSGLSSKYAIYIFTEKVLSCAIDLGQSSFRKGDVIYLTDPEEDEEAWPYDIYNEAPWRKNKGFELLTGYNQYTAIRREKQ